MPLHHVIHHGPDTQIYIWKITEPEDELRDTVSLNPRNQARIAGMKSQPHRRGFLSVRRLLQHVGYTDFDLHYDPSGKPHLADGRHISITHSHEFAAIALSGSNIGIDLEMCRDKAAVIAHRFLHETEIRMLDPDDPQYIPRITVLWGIKEVIFKIRNEPGISFKDHVRAEPFEMTDGQTTAYLEMDGLHGVFRIFFESVDHYILVYALDANPDP